MNLRIIIWVLLLMILSLQVLSLTASSSKNNKNVNKRSTTKRLVGREEQPLLKRSIRSINEHEEEVETVEEDDEDEDENDDEASININNTNSSSSNCSIILPPNYNKLETPRWRNESEDLNLDNIEVELKLTIGSIVDINEQKEEITLDLDMFLSWDDPILHWDIKKRCSEAVIAEAVANEEWVTFDPTFLNQLWKPDIFIENMVKVKQNDLMRKPTRLEIDLEGSVVVTKRMTIKIACEFEFQYYPADTQECDVILRSYAYGNDELNLFWFTNAGVYLPDVADDNFYIAIDSLKRYDLEPNLQQVSNHSNGVLGETFDALQFTLRIRRKLSYHIVQTYIPTMLYIAITWLCFMVPKSMIEARLAIVMTTLLTLTSMFASIRESTPAVSYVKAIDIWMLAGISFVFGVLLEFALILWTETEKRQVELDKLELARGSQTASIKINDDHPDFKPPSKTTSPSLVKKLRRNIIDKVEVVIGFIEAYSFVLIFVIFLLFNTSYWTWLFYMSGYFNWNVNELYNGLGKADERSQHILKELPLFRNSD